MKGELPDFCEWVPDSSRWPCYAPAALVLVRPGGETLRFVPRHLSAWPSRIQGRYLMLERDEWEARRCGSRRGAGWVDGGCAPVHAPPTGRSGPALRHVCGVI